MRAKRLTTPDGKPGVMKIQLKTVNMKINVLRNKQKLKKSEFDRVYIRTSQSHLERVQQLNMKAILEHIVQIR